MVKWDGAGGSSRNECYEVNSEPLTPSMSYLSCLCLVPPKSSRVQVRNGGFTPLVPTRLVHRRPILVHPMDTTSPTHTVHRGYVPQVGAHDIYRKRHRILLLKRVAWLRCRQCGGQCE